MPVPSSLNDLSTTPALNSPAGSESPALVDDYLRTHAAFIKQVSDSKDTLDAANVKLTGNQTIAGVKTFTGQIVASGGVSGNITGTAANITGTVAIANGGTGQATALAGFDALKQAATNAYTGVVELATGAEARAGTDAARVLTPSTLKSAQIQLGTAVNSTSGTAIDFTGIPSWAKRITVMFSGVSTNGTSRVQLQLGSGAFQTSGYAGFSGNPGGTNTAFSAAFVVNENVTAADIRHGAVTLVNVTGNTWAEFGVVSPVAVSSPTSSAGSVTLSGTLDRIRITTVNGTDTFDAGTVNISWE